MEVWIVLGIAIFILLMIAMGMIHDVVCKRIEAKCKREAARFDNPPIGFVHYDSGLSVIIIDEPHADVTYGTYPKTHVGELVEILYNRGLISLQDLRTILDMHSTHTS
jgi:hypothetical protein